MGNRVAILNLTATDFETSIDGEQLISGELLLQGDVQRFVNFKCFGRRLGWPGGIHQVVHKNNLLTQGEEGDGETICDLPTYLRDYMRLL